MLSWPNATAIGGAVSLFARRDRACADASFFAGKFACVSWWNNVPEPVGRLTFSPSSSSLAMSNIGHRSTTCGFSRRLRPVRVGSPS